MKIIIATANKAKIQAVQEVFEKVFNEVAIVGEKFDSKVAEQPLSEDEGIQGALNRASSAQEKFPKADYYIGLEGYVDTNNFGMFLGGAVVILDNRGNFGIGLSAKMQLPKVLKEKIEQGEELGPLMKKLMNDQHGKIRQFDGTNGILSKGLYNRVDEFKDATKCALSRFVSLGLYKQN